MSIFQAIILGIIQGVTEFLPVSSSGHLVLMQRIFGLSADAVLFDTALHLGTLFSLFFAMPKECSLLIKKPFSKMWWLLITATLPTVAAALIFGDKIEAAFSGDFLFLGFLLTSLVLFICERISMRTKNASMEVGYKNALIMGLMQALATLPGLSRSGSTAAGGLLSGLKRSTAVDFAMLMSIPAILGSIAYKGIDIIKTGADTSLILPSIVGMLFSAVFGFFSVKIMLNAVKKRRLYPFCVYTGVLGAFLLINKLFLNII